MWVRDSCNGIRSFNFHAANFFQILSFFFHFTTIGICHLFVPWHREYARIVLSCFVSTMVSFRAKTSDSYLWPIYIIKIEATNLKLHYLSWTINRQIFYLMTTLRTTISGIFSKLGPMWPLWKLFRCEKYFQSQPAHMGVGPHPIFQLTV